MGPGGEAVLGLETWPHTPTVGPPWTACTGSPPTSFLPSSLRLSLLPGDSSSLQSSTLMEWATGGGEEGGEKEGECAEEPGGTQ